MPDLLAPLKRHLNIEAAETDGDAYLRDLLATAVAKFERSTGRHLSVPDGDPVVTITRPVVGGIVRLPDARGVVTITTGGGTLVTGVELRSWGASETAVWAILPDDSTATSVAVAGQFGIVDLPADVADALVLYAAHRYRTRGAEGTGSGYGADPGEVVVDRLPPAYLSTVKDWRVPRSPITTVALGRV